MDLKLFSGRSNPLLARRIVDYLKLESGDVTIRDFSDGELWVRYNENIRGQDVFIVQSTNPPANNIMELMLMLDAAKRASARRVTAVIPYYGYARQDRKDQPRVPISAKLLADMINAAGADRVLTMDLHSAQIQGYFTIPFDHLYSKTALITHLKGMDFSDNLVLLSPDVGSIPLSRSYAKLMNASLAIIDKRRPVVNQLEVMHLIGEVEGKNVLIMDDMVDTAGTLVAAAETAMANGALSVYAACTHAVLSGPALERITNSAVRKMIVTDTIHVSAEKKIDKLEIVSVATVFGEAIDRIHKEESISSLFNF